MFFKKNWHAVAVIVLVVAVAVSAILWIVIDVPSVGTSPFGVPSVNLSGERPVSGKVNELVGDLPEVEYSVNYGNFDLWKRIFNEPGVFEMPDNVFAVILPHHLITATKLTKFYRGLSEQIDPQVVVLIGPNHFDSGEADVQVCNCSYATFDGEELKTNQKLLKEILESESSDANGMGEAGGVSGFTGEMGEEGVVSGVAILDNDSFEKEHSIFAHVNFIKHFFKDAEILPIILKQKVISGEKRAELDYLIEFLNGKKVLIIASVDFSHYLSKEIAGEHDVVSFDAIENFDYENFANSDLDSPETVYVVSKLAEKNGFKKVSLIEHTNSQDFFHFQTLTETTSHEYVTFSGE